MSNADVPESSTGTQKMLSDFGAMEQMCLDHEEVLGALPASPEQVKLLRDGLFCVRLGMIYYAEANRAVQANAWFAATAIGTAALEAVLLSKCLIQAEDVKALPRFRELKKKQTRDFRHFAEQLDLGKLLEIADSLSWFPPGGLSPAFAGILEKHLSSEEMEYLLSIFSSEENIGKLCAIELRKCRNLIHPSVCLKEGRMPSQEVGQLGTFLLLTAVSVLSKADSSLLQKRF